MHTRSISIVIPVRDGAELVGPCLESMVGQLREGDEILVVDDGSTDETSAIAARFGAFVIRMVEGSGPYAARNVGWKAAKGDVVVFTDVRCRARAGWLETTRACFEDSGVAIAASDINVLSGPSLAERVMAHRQAFLTRDYVQGSFFLPYFVTANLAMRRQVLVAVGGFGDMRSGGDADVCWRIQLAGLGMLALVDGVTMDWRARGTTREFLSQWRKYGVSHAHLRWEYQDFGLSVAPIPLRVVALRTSRTLGADLLKHRLGPRVSILDAYAVWIQYRTAAREARRLLRAEGQRS